jgi:chromosome segregation ATPase
VTKRPGSSGFDPRREPDEVPTTERHHIDRVFGRGTASSIAPDTLPSRPAMPRTTTGDVREGELALRRQLSRLERQLADAQRELSNKDEELAGELEKQLLAAAAVTQMQDQLRAERTRVDELSAQVANVAGIDQRMQETLAHVEELARALAAERAEREAAATKLEEAMAALATERAKWAEERANLDEHHGTELTAAETARRVAVETAVAAHDGDLIRMQEHHDGELVRLRESHDRALAALRGELEPQLLEARSLAADRERLAGEVATAKADSVRALSENKELHQRELVQTAVLHGDELAMQARQFGGELARAVAERDAANAVAAETGRAAQQRDQLWEATVSELRQSQKEMQLELTDVKAARARLETDKSSSDERLAAATRDIEWLAEENRTLRTRAETSDVELRRSAQDRARYIAYLEEGLAMLGALPPKTDPGDGDGGGEPKA